MNEIQSESAQQVQKFVSTTKPSQLASPSSSKPVAPANAQLEVALSAEPLLRLVLDNLPQASFWKDRNSVYLGCNQVFAEIAGLASPEDIVGKTDYDLPWKLEEADWYRQCDRRVMDADQAETHIVESILQADGCSKWIDTCKIPLHNAAGEVIGILGTFEDITDRRLAEITLEQAKAELEATIAVHTAELNQLVKQLQAEVAERQRVEAALKQKQQEYEVILNTVPAMIWYKDRENRWLRVNQAAADSVGLSVAELEGRSLYDVFPEVAATYHAEDLAIINSGQPMLNFIEKYQSKAGERWHETNKIPYRDSEGNILGVIVFAQDVTDRLLAEAALREREVMYRQILDAIPDMILCKGPQSRIIFGNQAFRDYYGMSLEELRDLIDAPFNDPDYTQQYIRDDAFVFNTGETLHIPEEPVTRYDGEVRLFHTIKSPIFDTEGNVVQTIGISRDITDRKQAEIALQNSEAQLREKAEELESTLYQLRETQAHMIQSEKMSSLGQLVAGVAHEINNPVNFIYGNLAHATGYAQDLLDVLEVYQKHYPTPHPEVAAEVEAIDLEFVREDLPKLLRSMKVGADRIQKIVASLRNFSRMDESEFKTVDIHDGIESTLLILQHRIKARADHAEIEIVKDYGSLPLVECYAGQLNQVFMNILANAIDALESQWETNPQLQPQIRIQTELITPDRIAIHIADNGLGMSEAVQRRIFEPFFTTKPVGQGTGIGMSISYEIVTGKHQGRLSCRSAPGQGAEFIIEIPLHQR